MVAKVSSSASYGTRFKLSKKNLELQLSTNLALLTRVLQLVFFYNNTSVEDRMEYLESLLRECKKEEAAPVLDDDALNDVFGRSS
ncbi:hypothetical protein PIB30_043975 [Stylosanthes scabra]|uniref:Uncharacterized protein n=1 Tax=Stylosanthes scabra TaxID=79078 RepID=A0ABU6RFQ2_9FABA|nr:hypothetical protein [Stylosanthes scabra]